MRDESTPLVIVDKCCRRVTRVSWNVKCMLSSWMMCASVWDDTACVVFGGVVVVVVVEVLGSVNDDDDDDREMNENASL